MGHQIIKYPSQFNFETTDRREIAQGIRISHRAIDLHVKTKDYIDYSIDQLTKMDWAAADIPIVQALLDHG